MHYTIVQFEQGDIILIHDLRQINLTSLQTGFFNTIKQSVYMLSLYLSQYTLLTSILFDAVASSRLEGKPKPNSHINCQILQFRLRVLLKVVLTLIKVFLNGVQGPSCNYLL